MASYQDIADVLRNDVLLERIGVAIIIAADTINSGNDIAAPWDQNSPQPANRKKWAKLAYSDALAMAKNMQSAVLAANSGATLNQITTVSDAAIQANINALVDIFADGGLA